jgi:hypothetical protein
LPVLPIAGLVSAGFMADHPPVGADAGNNAKLIMD